jgi:VCBS repeat-containing protein
LSKPHKVKARMLIDGQTTATSSAASVARVDETLQSAAAPMQAAAVTDPEASSTLSTKGASGVPLPNEAPVVVDEWITVKAGQPVSAHQSVLLGNDRDSDGGTLSITEFGKPSHGTLTKAADGTLTYVANGNYSGDDSFTYTVSDGQGGFTTGTVHIKVESCSPTNKPPVVVDEWASVRGTNPVSAHESVLLANDSDPEGGALTVRNLSDPPHGTLTRAADGTLTYKADAGFSGTDSFTYEVVDPQGNVTVGTVHLCVLPANLSVTITDVRDDVGAVQGTVVDEGRTDDRRPALQGKTEANALVDIYDGTTKLGQVKADASGNWSFTLTTDLGDGRHDFKAVATAVDGATAQSNEWSVTVDCGTTPPPPPPPPPPPALPAPVVAIGEDLNNDGLINKAEKTGPADAIVTLPVGAKAGDTLIVTDQSGAKQEKLLTAADIAAGKVTFVDGFAMPAEGQTLTLTAQIRSAEGVLSEKGTDAAVVDTTAPGNPIVTITTDSDNNGRINQGELTAAGGVDVKIDLPDTAKAGDKLIVVDQAGNKVEVTLTAAQIAAKSVTLDNAFPAPAHNATLTVTATLTDPAGNVSGPGSDSAIIDCPPPPPPPPPTVPAPVVTIANDVDNNGLLNRGEVQGRADIVVDLDPSVKAGDQVFIEDQAGNLIGRKLTVEEAAARQITFTDAFEFPAEGQTLRVESYIRTAGGALSTRSSDQAVVDTTGPGNPTVAIVTDTNNDGQISKAELTNAGGNDVRVGLPATAKVGDIMTVTDQDGNRVQRPLTAAEVAAGSVFLDNAFPNPGDGKTLTVSATLTDPAGNVSDTARDSAVMTLTAPTVTITIVDDKDNNGTITRNEIGAATRVDVRLDLPASIRAGDKVEVTDNQGNGVSKTVTAADVAAKQITFNDAFPLPASGATIEVTAKVTDTAGNESPLSKDSALFDGNYLPTGTDDVNTVRGFATPMATILAMNQDSGTVVPAGQTWVTTDGDAGRAVFGQLSSLLVAGMTVQISSSDHPGQWINAVVSSDGLRWTAVDNTTHSADWSYTARVLNTDGTVLTTSVAQAVDYRDAASGAPSIDSFGTQAGNSSIALGGETGDQTLVINGRASGGAASAGHTIEVFANGTSHPVGTAVVKADGTWSLDLSGTTLKDGSYNFYARDMDGGDWSNKATVNIEAPNGSVENWADWGQAIGYTTTVNTYGGTQPKGSLQTTDGVVNVTSQVTNDSWFGVMPSNNQVAGNLQGLFPGGSADGREGTGLYVYNKGVLTLSFDKAITDPNLLFFGPDSTVTVRAWDANGQLFQPTLSLVANSSTAGLGAITNNSFVGQSGQGVMEVQGQITKIEISQNAPSGNWEYYVQLGQKAARDGTSYGTDDGSIVPGTPSLVDNSGNDVLSFASQAALDAALAKGSIEGGDGIDTLRLTGTGMRLDLSNHSSTPGVDQDVNNYEKFDLGTGGKNSLVMSVNDVLAQGQTNAFTVNGRTQVMVLGDNTNSLTLSHLVDNGGDTGNWAAAGTVLVDGVSYNVFNHSSLPAQVLVKPGVQVLLPADPGTPAETTTFPQVSGQVLTNDDDPDGPEDQLRVAGVDNNPGVTPGENVGNRIEGTYGHLTLNADGTYTYVADKSAGLTTPQQDVFYYLPKDGQGAYAEKPVKLTINVDPALANVTSVSSPDTVTEGQDLVFTVGTSASSAATTMTLQVLSGSGTAGVDTTTPLQVNFGKGWVDVVGGQVSVPAGTTSYQVKVPTVDDKLIEKLETVQLKVTSTTGSNAQGTGTIMDNDLQGNTAQGTEDNPVTLTWNHFNLDNLPGATKLQITQLPADGKLEFNDNGTWRAVAVNQQFSKDDIQASKLRFVPDANESGTDAYAAPGVGNKLSDYAELQFTAFDQGTLPFTGGKLAIDISPDADLGTLSVRATPSSYGSLAGLGGYVWDKYTFTVSGASGDTDGSERTRIALSNKPADYSLNSTDARVAIIDATGVAKLVTPDANGLFWVSPTDQVFVSQFTLPGHPVPYSSIAFTLWREEVNAAGTVLDAEKTGTSGNYWCPPSPLVLDLNGDGVQTVGQTDGVYFDLDADGRTTRVGWTDGKDGLLALDRNGDGQITSGAELFGDHTPSAAGGKAANGFTALSELDSNHDGKFDAQDSLWQNVQVWVDSDHDGVSQGSELKGLAEVGVESINLSALEGSSYQHGNFFGLHGSGTLQSGQAFDVVDVWFQDSNEEAPAAQNTALSAADVLTDKAALALEPASAPHASHTAADGDVQWAGHAVNHHRVVFERWDEPTQAML